MNRLSRFLTRLTASLSLAAGLLIATPRAFAATQMHVDVPFAFTANNVSMPAGSYTLVSRSNHFLCLTNDTTGRTRVFAIRYEDGQKNQGATRLTFRRQPGGAYLSQIWIAAADSHIEMIAHPRPKLEMAKSSPAVSTFEIATK